jgi:hypothetical protein
VALTGCSTTPLADRLAGSTVRPSSRRPEVAEIGTVGQRLNRWPYPAIPRGTQDIPRGFFIHARR